jgi:hypothetical protein
MKEEDVTQLWTVVEVGPVLEVNQPATPTDILAEARNIEGAEESERCVEHNSEGPYDYHSRNCVWAPVLVVPLDEGIGE